MWEAQAALTASDRYANLDDETMALDSRLSKFLDAWEEDQEEGRTFRAIAGKLTEHVEEDRVAFSRLREAVSELREQRDVRDLRDEVETLSTDVRALLLRVAGVEIPQAIPLPPIPVRERLPSAPGAVTVNVSAPEPAPPKEASFDFKKVIDHPLGRAVLLLLTGFAGWLVNHFGLH